MFVQPGSRNTAALKYYSTIKHINIVHPTCAGWYCVAKYCINFLLQYLNVYRFRNGCKTSPDGLIVSNSSEYKSCILTFEQVKCTNVMLTLITRDTHNLLTSFLWMYKLYGISLGGHLQP